MDHVLGPVGDFPPGTSRIVEVGGRSIGVFNVDGTFYALRNRCPHQGGPLCRGMVQGKWESPRVYERVINEEERVLKCPWHGWQFDLSTGKFVSLPQRWRVATYPVRLESARVETYPVGVEDDMVVLQV